MPETEQEVIKPQEQKNEWLSFSLADSSYAIDILRVIEIRVWEQVTRIPDSEDYVLGLINLRGSIVPIVDLRKRMGLPAREFDQTTVVLILSVETPGENKVVGMVVDAISDVLELPVQGHTAPDFDLAIDRLFVKGIADYKDKMVVLLDVDSVLAIEADSS